MNGEAFNEYIIFLNEIILGFIVIYIKIVKAGGGMFV